MGQVMARAVLVGEDGCVLLAQLLASFCLLMGRLVPRLATPRRAGLAT